MDENFRNGQILLTDDDPESRNVVREMLGLLEPSLQVREALDGIEAMEMVKDWVPDLVILDLMMPNLDGYGVLERLRMDTRFKLVPVLVLTSYGHQDTAADVIEAGGDDFIAKPVALNELQYRVRALLRAKTRTDGLKLMLDMTRRKLRRALEENRRLRAERSGIHSPEAAGVPGTGEASVPGKSPPAP